MLNVTLSIVVLLLHYHNVEMSINEIGLARLPLVTNNHGFQQLEILHTCLKSTKDFFELFLSLPVHHFRFLAIFTYTQMTHVLIVLYKLSTFESQDWDLAYVRETLDFGSVLDRIVGWAKNILAHAENDEVNLDEMDVFSRTIAKVEKLKTLHKQKTASSSKAAEMSSAVFEAGGEGIPLDFFNDAWLEEMLAPWDYQATLDLP